MDAEGSILTTGQLGVRRPSSNTFERIDFPDTQGLQQPLRFEQVSFTYFHALAVTTGGVLFSWGRGASGQLGHGSTEDNDAPRLVRALEGVPIASAAAGDHTSLALARSGEMWSWGQGAALGHGGDGKSQQLLPKVIGDSPPGASVLRIAAGGTMAACVRTDGTTPIWGKFRYSGAPETANTPALLRE